MIKTFGWRPDLNTIFAEISTMLSKASELLKFISESDSESDSESGVLFVEPKLERFLNLPEITKKVKSTEQKQDQQVGEQVDVDESARHVVQYVTKCDRTEADEEQTREL